ncbi:MAG: site-specific integrase [Candidatus Acidiferrum sp.]
MEDQIAVFPQTRGWLSKSVLEPVVQPYIEHLVARRYARSTVHAYVYDIAHFAHWMSNRHIDLDQFDETAIQMFIEQHLSRCNCPEPVRRQRCELRAALNQLLVVLRAAHLISQRVFPTGSIEDELRQFDSHLDENCGLASNTRGQRIRIVRRFLKSRFGNSPIQVARLTTQAIHGFVVNGLKGCKPSSGGVICVALRSYLRYRALKGDRVEALVAAVPTVAAWRLSGLPEILSAEELNQFLNTFDRRSISGQRGYAMVRCLADLGLRAHEVVRLQLDDLNWREGTLKLPKNKSRRVDVLPLPELTGQAITEYIRLGRPKTHNRSLFVRLRAPQEEPIDTGCVHRTVREAFARCGLNRSGTHLLRHTVAGQLLQAGSSLKQIADILRHRSIDTTAIYTKVDLHRLSAVAMPWPGSKA